MDPNHLSIKRENEYLSGLKIDEEQMQISVEQTTAGIHIENEEGISLSQFSLKQIRDGKVLEEQGSFQKPRFKIKYKFCKPFI